MPQVGWLIGGGLLGLALAGWSIRRGRRAYPHDTSVLHWHERVVSAWRQDATGALFIGIHAGTVVALGLLAAMHALQRAAEPPPPAGAPVYLLLGVLAGAVLGFPLASRIGPPMPMALYPDGVVRGRFVSDWSGYSHFVADPASGLIRLYSPRVPAIARVAWRPPTDELFREVVAFLVRYLPAAPAAPRSWYRARGTFLAFGAAITMGPLLAAVAVVQSGSRWTPLFLAGTAYLVCLAGILLIRSYRLD